MGMDALPFCKVTLQRKRCLQGPYFVQRKNYPTNPKTIGEAIRKRRLDLGLRQVDVAKEIGCDEMTVVNWEKGHSTPRINYLANVVKFLGFDPFPNGETLAQQLIKRRKVRGVTQKALARELGIDPSRLGRYERG